MAYWTSEEMQKLRLIELDNKKVSIRNVARLAFPGLSPRSLQAIVNQVRFIRDTRTNQ